MPDIPASGPRPPSGGEDELINAALRQEQGPGVTSGITPPLETLSLPGGLPPPGAAAVPPRIPDFEVIRLLGRGGFGEVWLARCKVDVYRAIKVLPKRALTQVELNGIRTCAIQAGGHPNVITVLHVGETPDWLYYVMELADGYRTAPTFHSDDYEPRTLQSDLGRRGHLQFAEAISIARQVLAGLRHLHERDLLHRDVKPGNVVFVDGVAKLADIGLVVQASRRVGGGGTWAYAPPEGVVDRSGDLYALGKTLYQMVTGLPAERFPAVPEDAGAEQRDSVARLAPVLKRACAQEPGERFQTAEEFDHALGQACRRPWRRRVLAGGAIVLALGAALASWGLLGRPGRTAPSGELGVLFRESSQTQTHYELSRSSIPLRTGELIKVRATLDPPGYPVVALVTRQAGVPKVQLAYPTSRPGEAPVTEVLVPPGDEWWELEPPEGGDGCETVTFVLLASDRPVVDAEKILERLAGLGAAPVVDVDTMFVLKAGRPELIRAPAGRSRGIPDVRRTVQSSGGLLDRLPGEFGKEFPVICAVAFPQSGPPGERSESEEGRKPPATRPASTPSH